MGTQQLVDLFGKVRGQDFLKCLFRDFVGFAYLHRPRKQPNWRNDCHKMVLVSRDNALFLNGAMTTYNQLAIHIEQ